MEFLARHARRMLAFVLSVMVAVVVMMALTPSTYRSEGRLLVRLDRPSSSGVGSKAAEPPVSRGVVSGDDNAIDSVVALLQSRSLVERVVDELGPRVVLGDEPYVGERSKDSVADAPPTREEIALARRAWDAQVRGEGLVAVAGGPALSWPQGLTIRWREWLPCWEGACVRERAIQHVVEHLTVAPVGRSAVVRVAYQAPSPELAQRVVQRVIGLFRDQHAALHPVDDPVARLELRAKELWERLETLERRRRESPDTKLAASLESQRRIAVARAAGLEDDVLAVDAQLAAARAKVQALTARLEGLPQTIETKPRGEAITALENLRQQVARLREREAELLAKYTEEVSLVQEVRRQIAEAEAVLDREEASRKEASASPNPAYTEASQALLQARTELAALAARGDTLRRQLAEARAVLGRVDDQERSVEAERDLELLEETRQQIADLLAQVREGQTSDVGPGSNVEVVQSPSLEVRALGPHKPALVGLGFILAILGALALGFLTDQVDPQPV